MLIAIEGVDGAGKNTVTKELRSTFESRGKTVATRGFPRYGQSVTADIAAEALHGEHGDLVSSAYAMATLFALDRAGAADEISGLLDRYDVVILDRYVASNAAYSAARLRQGAAGEVVDWVRALEFGRLALPRPAWQLLLDVPVELADSRARGRAEGDPTRARDAYERDGGLQRRTSAVYAALAAAQWCGRWLVVGPQMSAEDIVPLLV
ncbi:MAG: dTMP kinase [Mycobacterium sp.]